MVKLYLSSHNKLKDPLVCSEWWSWLVIIGRAWLNEGKKERRRKKERINGPRAEMSYELALQENCSVPVLACRLMSIIKRRGGRRNGRRSSHEEDCCSVPILHGYMLSLCPINVVVVVGLSSIRIGP